MQELSHLSKTTIIVTVENDIDIDNNDLGLQRFSHLDVPTK